MNDAPASAHPETIALHAGWRADPTTGSVAVPIHQTTCFQFQDTGHAARLFGLEEMGNIYSRIMNPTVDVLEKRVAALEGGAAALGVASGQAATAFSVLNLCAAGDNLVCSTDVYGGTWNLFSNTLKQFGVEVRFVDPADPEGFARATDDRTRCWYAETLPNPSLRVFPIAEVAALGRRLGVPLIVDNTAAPVLCRPFEHGAAVVVHSTTKWIGGHASSIGGVVVDGGNFPWDAHPERFPTLNAPDPSYHGAVWVEATRALGPVAYVVRMRTCLLRDLGAPMSPFNAFLFLQGLETLPLRMERHCANAARVAAHLAAHPAVSRVVHPSLATGEERRRAEAHLRGGHGGLVGFELHGGSDGGREAGQRFIEGLRLFYHVANIGDARSLAIHPATTTHSQLDEAEQRASGVTPGYVRLSVGIEHVDDILADLDRALDAASGALAAPARRAAE